MAIHFCVMIRSRFSSKCSAPGAHAIVIELCGVETAVRADRIGIGRRRARGIGHVGVGTARAPLLERQPDRILIEPRASSSDPQRSSYSARRKVTSAAFIHR